MATRFLGRMGENTLRLWCSQVGIIENKADEDLAGWDYLIEFPLPASSKPRQIPLDKEPFPLRCFLQVKASDDRPGERQVKLDNWLRLVKNPLPCFFLFLEFNNRDVCQRAFLVHIDKGYITQVLKRLRQVKPDDTDKLHKMTMIFKYSEADALNSLDGKGLSEAINKHVLVSPEDYATEKKEIIRTVGYEDGHWSISVTFLPPPESNADPHEALVDFLIGLTPHLDIIKAVLKDFRFGILAPETQEISGEGGRIKVERKSIGNGIIRMRASDTQEEIRINTEVYAPPIANIEVPGKYFKVRFAAPFVNFIIWPKYSNNCTFQYHLPDLTDTNKLKDFQPVSRLLLFLQKAAETQSLVSIEMNLNSLPLGSASLKMNSLFDAMTIRVVQTMRNAWIIVKYFDLDQDIEVVPVELLEREDPLRFMAGILGHDESSYQVTFWLSANMPDEGLPFCVPLSGIVKIGKYRLVIAVAVLGKVEPTGQIGDEGAQYQLTASEVKVCRQYLYDSDEHIPHTRDSLKQIVTEEYKEKTQVITIDNL
jgi:hypothetical protein